VLWFGPCDALDGFDGGGDRGFRRRRPVQVARKPLEKRVNLGIGSSGLGLVSRGICLRILWIQESLTNLIVGEAVKFWAWVLGFRY
jgi:hypothetical protein